MAELVFFVIALLCLFGSAQASVFFALVALAIVAVKRANLAKRFEEAKDQLQKAADLQKSVDLLRDEVAVLRVQLKEFRASAPVSAAPAVEKATVAAPPKEEHKPAPERIEPPATSQPVPVTKPAPDEPQAPPVRIPAPAPVPPKPVAPQPVAPPSAPPPRVVVTSVPYTAPLRQAPRATAEPPQPVRQPESAVPVGERLKSALDIEEALGTNWLNKLGVIILVLGVALFGIYEFNQMGAVGKVLLATTAGMVLLISGILFERHERYLILGRTGIGGGWSLLFFTAYAIYHVAAMRLPLNETADLLLMLVVAIGMAFHTLRYKSQLVTGLAFLLAYSTIALSHDTVYSLSAGAILALGLVILVVKMNWYELEVFGILSSYLNHFYWLYKILGAEGANHRRFAEFWASTTILLLYWIVYRGSYVIRQIRTTQEEHVSTIAALLNTTLLLAVMKFQSSRPELAFHALFALGILEFGFGQLPSTRRRRTAFVILSTMGLILMVAAVPFRYSGGNVALLWMAGGEVFLFAGIALKESVFRKLGLLTGFAAAVHVMAIDAAPFLQQRIATDARLTTSGILFLTLGALYYLNSQFLPRRWEQMSDEAFEMGLTMAHSYLGAIGLSLGAWAMVTGDWTVLAWGAIVLVLSFAAGRLDAVDLLVHSSVLGLVTICRAVVVNLRSASDPVTRKHQLIAVPVVAAVYYVSAKFLSRLDSEAQKLVRDVFTLAGTIAVAVLIFRQVPPPWIAVAWIAYAAALALIGRKLNIAALVYQENALAVAAIVWTVSFNYSLTSSQYGYLPLRTLTVSIVAAALYALSRRSSPPDSENWKPIAYFHTWAATGLLAALAWYEVPSVWIAVIWAAFAFALALIDRRFEWSDLRWQGHALAAMAAVRIATTNLYVSNNWHNVSLRLITIGAVILAFYGLSRVVRMPQELRDRDLHHVYTWTASALAGLLFWYELQPLSVAVAWALLGFLLFETGVMRKSRQIRFQGYVALVSAFARIFFANLAIPTLPGELIGPRILTVLPVAATLFFVYEQLQSQQDALPEFRIRVDGMLCYAGTIAISALVYFQLSVRADWIVTAWAALVLALFTVALLLGRRIFLHQALLLTLAAFSRGVLHNLFGESYFNGGDWTGRYVVLGAAVAVMFLTLPFAFRLRIRPFPDDDKSGLPRIAAILASRPEQIMFFVPFVLLTLMLALKLRAGMVTVAWGIEAILVFLMALAIKELSYRWAASALIIVCIGKLALMDIWRLQARDRYITFIIIGIVFVTVSFLYSKYREQIRQLL